MANQFSVSAAGFSANGLTIAHTRYFIGGLANQLMKITRRAFDITYIGAAMLLAGNIAQRFAIGVVIAAGDKRAVTFAGQGANILDGCAAKTRWTIVVAAFTVDTKKSVFFAIAV